MVYSRTLCYNLKTIFLRFLLLKVLFLRIGQNLRCTMITLLINIVQYNTYIIDQSTLHNAFTYLNDQYCPMLTLLPDQHCTMLTLLIDQHCMMLTLLIDQHCMMPTLFIDQHCMINTYIIDYSTL